MNHTTQTGRAAKQPSTRNTLAAGVAALALVIGAPAFAQQAQPQQGQQAQGTQPSQAPSQRPGSDQPVVMGQIRTAEQALRLAQRQMSGEQRPNVAQARTAVTAGMAVIGRVPNELQAEEVFRTAREQLTEANQALQGQQPDASRAAAQLGEAADAMAALAQRVGGTAAQAGQGTQQQRTAAQAGQGNPQQQQGAAAAAAGSGAQIAVQQRAPEVTVQQQQPQITVQQPAPQVTVQQPEPQVTVQQPQPQVTVRQAEPQVTVQQARPEVSVQQAQPQVTVQRQGEPQVTVQRQSEPQVNVQRQGEPQVNVQRQGEAQVQQPAQPRPAQQQTAQQRSDQQTGASATPAPAQSAGSQPQQAATTQSAGVPLQRVQELIGTDVYGAEGRQAGEIRNLLIDANGQVRGAVVEWGGFLGIGQREALVPIERLRLGEASNDRVVLTMTREELEALPRYDRDTVATDARDRGWGEGTRLFR